MDVVVQDPHPEAAPAPGELAADAPEADDPQGRAMKVDAHEEHRSPGAPLAIADVVDALRDPARGGREEGEGEVGGRLGQDARRVPRGDAAASERGDVDVVEADGEVADHLQLRAGGVEQLVVDPIGEEAQEAVDAGDAS